MKHWPVLLILLIAFFLRTLYLPRGGFPFSYDQARDAFIIKDLLQGDIKIQGPPTSTQDFFHGVLYYYVLAPGYFIGRGSPIIAAAWLSFINSLGVIMIYAFAQALFHRRFLSGLAALLYAFSYEQTQYSFYLANTALAALTVPLFYFGLWLWHRKHRLGPLVAGLGLGLSFQANFIFIYHLIPLLVGLILRKINLSQVTAGAFVLAFMLSISTMIASEIKFGFPSRAGPASLLSRSHYATLNVQPTAIAATAFRQFSRLVSLNLFPTSPAQVTIAFIVAFALLSFFAPPSWWWLLSPAIISFAPPLIIGGIGTPYIHAGLGSLIILFTIFLFSRFKPLAFFLMPVMLISHLRYITTRNSRGLTEFAIQKTMTLANELAAIDYIYSQAEGHPFSVNTVTAPLNVNTTWSYLFNWYGQQKYGYLPYWHGPDQSGQPGDNLSRPGPTARYFLIIEPSQGIPTDLINSQVAQETKLSHFNHQRQFGEITVHARTRK